MANNKFKIENLNSLAGNIVSTDYMLIEKSGTSYKLPATQLYKDVIINHISANVARENPLGPNILSISYIDDNNNLINSTSVKLQDGMLSAAKFNDTTNVLSLYFNATDPTVSPNPLTVNLNSLKDIYTAGYGLSLNSNKFAISLDFNGLSSKVDTLSSNINTLCNTVNIHTINITTLCNNFNNYIPTSCETNLSNDISNGLTNKIPTGQAVNNYVSAMMSNIGLMGYPDWIYQTSYYNTNHLILDIISAEGHTGPLSYNDYQPCRYINNTGNDVYAFIFAYGDSSGDWYRNVQPVISTEMIVAVGYDYDQIKDPIPYPYRCIEWIGAVGSYCRLFSLKQGHSIRVEAHLKYNGSFTTMAPSSGTRYNHGYRQIIIIKPR